MATSKLSKFGRLLEQYCREHEIYNQTQLCKELKGKYKVQAINKYFNGKLNPPKEFVHDVQIALSLSLKQVEMLWTMRGLDFFIEYTKTYGELDE